MRILIVEDQFLIAMTLEDMLLEFGHRILGPVATYDDALAHCEGADMAFVDVQLADGPTGPKIAESLVSKGVTVIFTTANPELVEGSRSAIGVINKPYDAAEIAAAIDFVAALGQGHSIPPHRSLRLLQEITATASVGRILPA